MPPINDRLRELRLTRGFSVSELAARIKKTAGYVSRFEGRSDVPSAELLCILAEIYEVEPEELLELAKQSQLAQMKFNIERKHESVLGLYRKERNPNDRTES